MIAVEQEFKEALESNGLIIDGLPIMDGKLRRVAVLGDKGRQTSGAYIGYLDGRPAGFIQNFKAGIKLNWVSDTKEYTHIPINRKEIQKRKQEQEDELLALWEKSAKILSSEYSEAKWAYSQNPYLKSKGFEENFYLKQDKRGNLLIPLRDINSKLWSVQRIFSNGDKIIGMSKADNPEGLNVRKKGLFSLIGASPFALSKLDAFYIAEGFATSASIFKATGKPCIMCIDAGNMKEVVSSLSKAFPNKEIVLFADNDRKNKNANVGLKSAILSATNQTIENNLNQEIDLQTICLIAKDFKNISVVAPRFSEDEIKQGWSDYNDIHKHKGLESLKSLIAKQLKWYEVNQTKEAKKPKSQDKGFSR